MNLIKFIGVVNDFIIDLNHKNLYTKTNAKGKHVAV